MPTRKNLSHRIQERKTRAINRQAYRDERSPREQLDKLIAEGHGHCKEAQKLFHREGE